MLRGRQPRAAAAAGVGQNPYSFFLYSDQLLDKPIRIPLLLAPLVSPWEGVWWRGMRVSRASVSTGLRSQHARARIRLRPQIAIIAADVDSVATRMKRRRLNCSRPSIYVQIPARYAPSLTDTEPDYRGPGVEVYVYRIVRGAPSRQSAARYSSARARPRRRC